MLDDMFPFIDPIIELSKDDTRFVIQAEIFFDEIEKNSLDKKVGLPGEAKIELPLDIVISLLRPEELEKLQKYIAFYFAKYTSGEWGERE